MIRTSMLAMAVAVILASANPSFAESYNTNCDQAPQGGWAQCVLDTTADAAGGE